MDEWMKQLEHCMLCPRACGVNRITGNTGACHTDAQMRVARAALHFWEEPCISGQEGSGAIFLQDVPWDAFFARIQTFPEDRQESL